MADRSKKLTAMLSKGASKTSNDYANLPSADLRASSMSRQDSKRRQKKKKLAEQYMIPEEGQDVFSNQADAYTSLLDESRRNKLLGLFDPSKYSYNDVLPFINKEVGDDLTPGALNMLNDVRNAMLNATEYPVPFDIKSDPHSDHFKSSMRREVGLNLSPFTPFPLLRMGDIPSYEDMAANNFGGSVNLWESDAEGNNVPLSGSLIHTHNLNENTTENHGGDMELAAMYPGTQNFTVDNQGVVEYDQQGIKKKWDKSGGLTHRRRSKFANVLFNQNLK